MSLSDLSIERNLGKNGFAIRPYDVQFLSGSSYDVHFGRAIKRLVPNNVILDARSNVMLSVMDTAKPAQYEDLQIEDSGTLLLPDTLYLGVTQEWIRLPDNWDATLNGVSSVGRVGVEAHCQAGYIDPGFFGHITLEIRVTLPTTIYPFTECGQLVFGKCDGEVRRVYNAANGHHYTNEFSETPQPMPSQYHKKVQRALETTRKM